MVIDKEKQKARYKRYYYRHRITKLLKEKIKYDSIKVKEYNREYYLKHKKKIDKKNRTYDREHPDKLKERSKRNYEEKRKNKKFIESLD